MTVYPDVVKIHNGRPLHVDAKEHRAKCEAFISDVPVVHLRNLTVETQLQFFFVSGQLYAPPPLQKAKALRKRNILCSRVPFVVARGQLDVFWESQRLLVDSQPPNAITFTTEKIER
jgi:hypothetical protein